MIMNRHGSFYPLEDYANDRADSTSVDVFQGISDQIRSSFPSESSSFRCFKVTANLLVLSTTKVKADMSSHRTKGVY